MTTARLLFAALCATLLLGLTLWLGLTFLRPTPPPQISGFYLEQPRPMPQFSLVHHSGEPFTLENLRGRWTFIYFGFTYCPDACPLTLNTLNIAQRELAARDADHDTGYLFISVDPKRDTPERLREYTGYFNSRFEGATGEPMELDRLTRPLGVVFMYPDGTEGDSYYVDHSSTILLVNPRGELQAVFTPPQQADDLVHDFIRIRERFRA